jgi:hypothetical protein|tara:strand:- start:323 stop:739 length:417 start_codon:yes stop_codon:yes gene_type:complete
MLRKKSSKLLKKLKNTPLRYTEMQRFVFELSNNEKWNYKSYGGYWSTNLGKLIHESKVIEKRGKKYYITKKGIKNIKTPFKTCYYKPPIQTKSPNLVEFEDVCSCGGYIYGTGFANSDGEIVSFKFQECHACGWHQYS